MFAQTSEEAIRLVLQTLVFQSQRNNLIDLRLHQQSKVTQPPHHVAVVGGTLPPL